MSARSCWRWGNSTLSIFQSLPQIIKCSNHLVFKCHILKTCHFMDCLITTEWHSLFEKPTKPVFVPADFPWVMTELTTSKPAECQFHQTYRAPVLRSLHKINWEMIDGPAEAPVAPLLTSCYHLLGCQKKWSCTSLNLHAQPDIKSISVFVFLSPSATLTQNHTKQ